MDGRKCIIYLPNDGKLDLTVHGKQLGKDLWKIVVRKLHLREEDYFGLKYKTSGEHYSWLQPDKRVLDHDIEMKSTVYPFEFLFSVKFFEDSVTVHKHPSTVELIFLHAQNLIYNGEICVPSDLSLELSAFSLQAFYGDFVSEEIAFANFKKLSCLPRSVIQELPSLEYCEEQVISWYKNLCGISKGQAVLLYMSKVEKLSTYGIHFFKVKDKARVHWWLGICNKGIYQYRSDNKVSPHHIFQWRNLENLYFREKKFSVEVCSGHKRALSTESTNVVTEKPKKAGNNQLAPKTHTWYGSPALIKSIWTMAIAQHQFYWDRKQSSKRKSRENNTNASNLRNALDKNSNSHIIPPSNDSIMQRKTNRKKVETIPKVKRVASKPPSSPKSPEVKALEETMISDLKKRKLALEDRLYDKVQELKEICKEEYNLTERLPIEYFRYMLPTEDRPVLKKKIGAEYRVQLRPHPNRAYKLDLASETELQKLESECELLTQITKAAYKLAYDPSSKGRMKRKRLQSYQKSLKKLQDVENRVNELRKKQGQELAFRQSTLIMTSDFDIMKQMKECSIDEKSDKESLSSGNMLEDETSISSSTEVHSTHSTPALSQRPYSGSADVDLPIQRSRTPPPTKSTKVAWLESPRVKNKKKGQLSPSGSYLVLPSPTSYRSTPSHSSGTETPPHQGQREWGLKWGHPRHNEGKMSSLDSLDSIGSRKSNDRAHGSPTKHQFANGDTLNANARRIAKATKSAQAHKVDLREKHVHSEPSRRMGTINPVLEIVQDTVPDDGKDSRTSLTDSGVGTDSRVQSCQEEEVAKKRQTSHAIRRDISDSSLSELSTQSNPAVLPSRRHIPKFVPSIMTRRNRAVTQLEQTPPSEESAKEIEHSHIRKRSSSFTESASSTPTNPTSKRDHHRALTQSKTLNENGNPNPDLPDSLHQNGSIPSQQDVANTSRPGLAESQNQLPPPIFDTNWNIRRQYLSRSQGQLVQNNSSATPPPDSENATSGRPCISVVDTPVNATNPANVQRQTYPVSVNNNNNKSNFGQIYKLSQPQVTQNYNPRERSQILREVTSSHNVPKCSSLDSVLDRGRQAEPDVNQDEMRNYAVEHQHPVQSHPTPNQYPPFYSPIENTAQRSGTPQVASSQQAMTLSDRDKYNNEAFEEIIGMGWVPSLDEYGSRASVAESLPAKSKREDIRELLHQHFAQRRPNRTPSSLSTTAMTAKREKQLQARIRAEMMKEKESENNRESSLKSDPSVNTWEDYKQNMTLKKYQNQGAYKPTSKSEHAGVNIFAHKAPPPLPQQTQRTFTKSSDTASGYSQGTIHKGYVNPNGYVRSMHATAAEERRNPPSNHVTSQRDLQTGKNMQSLQQGQANYYYQANLQAQQSKMPEEDKKKQSKRDKSPRTISESENGAFVIQATRTSPGGHKVSVFTITKSTPNTPIPPKRQEKDDEDDHWFFDADKTITNEAESTPVASPSRLTRSISETSEQSNTDVMQALAIEDARVAQKALTSSRGNLDKFVTPSKIPPPLPATPPSSNFPSSTRGRRSAKDFGTTVKGSDKSGKSGATRLEKSTPAPRKIPIPETKTPRLRSKTRKDRESSTGRSPSPSTRNCVTIPVSDLRSGAKTPNRAQRSPSPNPVIPNFHRMLSTPIATKPVALQQNGSPKNNKSTGMNKDPLCGVLARSRPPATPTVTDSTPTLTRSALKTTPAESGKLDTPRPISQIGQSGTLPRTPRAHKRIERSGSTSGSVYQASRFARSLSTTPNTDSRSQHGRSYIPTPRKELYNVLLGSDERINYKRSSSETWKQQNLVTVNIPHQHHHAVLDPQQHHHQLYHPIGHQGMDPRAPHEHPRRTASAEDLLWPTPDGRDPNANLNIRKQQGTLV